MLQAWETWYPAQQAVVEPELVFLDKAIKKQDDAVQELIKERSREYQRVNKRYTHALEKIQLPKNWLTQSWAGIVSNLRRQQVQQEQAVAKAMGSPEAQRAHEKAVEALKAQLQQLEQQLLDEARVLFDWEAFFDVEQTGIPLEDEKLKQQLLGHGITDLISIKELNWIDKGKLEIKTDTQTVVLDKEQYKQLDTFYELCNFYLEPRTFAHNHHINNAPDFLKARFEQLQRTYRQELQVLEAAHKARQETFQLPLQKALVLTKWQLEEMEALTQERRLALSKVEEVYRVRYAIIQVKIKEQLQQRSALTEKFEKETLAYWKQLEVGKAYIDSNQQLKRQVEHLRRLL